MLVVLEVSQAFITNQQMSYIDIELYDSPNIKRPAIIVSRRDDSISKIYTLEVSYYPSNYNHYIINKLDYLVRRYGIDNISRTFYNNEYLMKQVSAHKNKTYLVQSRLRSLIDASIINTSTTSKYINKYLDNPISGIIDEYTGGLYVRGCIDCLITKLSQLIELHGWNPSVYIV